MTTDRVMLLIDADNVSVDVIEQAVAHLLLQHGALHVRRAYGTPESAAKDQAVFKRLSIRPMVNLAAGKNSTDIALAVDAMDLVLAERPDVVAIASSDSDFAPLVGRLREKGCRVVGIGQEGKTGDETRAVYDEYTVFAHRKGGAAAGARPARKTATRPATKTASRTAAKAAPAPAPAAVAPAKKASPRRKAVAATPAPNPATVVPELVQRILGTLPELGQGGRMELRVASQRLRDAGLLSRSGSCTRLFGQFADRFELLPAGQPNHVRLRAEA